MQELNDDQIDTQHWDAIESLRQIESDALWDHVAALRRASTPGVLNRALAWCKDPDPFRRSIGVSILAQFGPDGKDYPHESQAMICSMIETEQDHEVITSLICAVNFREVHEALEWLISLADHPSEDIRWTVAWALPIPNGQDLKADPATLETLMKLSVDSEPQVRDWATFSLAGSDDDSPEIRKTLLARLSDTDFCTRSEAAIGLAKRKEPGGIKPLADCLMSDQVGELYVQAAEMYADTRLGPALLSLKKWWDVDPELLDRAIAACS